MSKRGGKRGGVTFTKPPEPAFLRKLKEQMGFQEGPNVDTKRAELDQATAEDEEDRDDERPTVVVLKSGDLTEEEAEKLGAFPDPDSEKDGDDKEELDESGKVVFRKPTKRSLEESSTSEIRKKIEKKESSMKKVKNKTLLSFDDEEDDDSE